MQFPGTQKQLEYTKGKWKCQHVQSLRIPIVLNPNNGTCKTTFIIHNLLNIYMFSAVVFLSKSITFKVFRDLLNKHGAIISASCTALGVKKQY